MITDALGRSAIWPLAFAVNDLFVATETCVPRRRKRAMLAVLLIGALMQTCMVVAANLRRAPVLPLLSFLANFCLLALPVLFWPVVARLRRGG